MNARKTAPRNANPRVVTKLASGVKLDHFSQLRIGDAHGHAGDSSQSPSAVAEPEIHREIAFLANSNRNLGMIIDTLYERLDPVMRPAGQPSDSAAEAACESTIGHRIREERTVANTHAQRLSDLISRLAV
ncbi:hypothetical protein D3C87_1451140 [compost metagenome]